MKSGYLYPSVQTLFIYFRNNIYIWGFADPIKNISVVLNSVSLLGTNSALVHLTCSHVGASPAFPILSHARNGQTECGLVLTPLVAFRSLQTYTQAHKQWPLEPTNSLTWGDSWSFLFIFFLKYKSKYVPYSFFQLLDIIQSQQNHINCVTCSMDKQCCPSYVVQVCSTAYIDLKHKIS